MKSFLEEYGFAILAAIVIILLIAMASPLGDIIRTQLSNIVNKFANSANKKLDAADAGDATAVLAGGKVTITANSETDQFKGILHGVEGGSAVTYILNGGTGKNTLTKNPTLGDDPENNPLPVFDEYDAATGFTITKDYATAVAKLDNGSEYYMEIVNVGTGETFYSNRVKVKK